MAQYRFPAQAYPQTVHAPVTPVRPAAIKGRNVEIFIGGTQVSSRWTTRSFGTLEKVSRRLRALRRKGKIGVGLYAGNGTGYVVEMGRSPRHRMDVEWLHGEILPAVLPRIDSCPLIGERLA